MTSADITSGQTRGFAGLPGLTDAELDHAKPVVERLWAATREGFAWARVPAIALRHRKLLGELASSLRQLPELRVEPSDTPEGHELARLLLGSRRQSVYRRRPQARVRYGGLLLRMPDRRAAVAVLNVPRDFTTYAVGHQRQALRTNLARAREHGIVTREIPPGPEQLDYVEQVLVTRQDSWLGEHRDWLERAVAAKLVRLFVGQAPDGTILTVALVVVDAPWALLRLFVSVEQELSGYARYATHSYLVEALSTSGVSALIVDSVFDASPGVRYFQDRLGFELFNIVVG